MPTLTIGNTDIEYEIRWSAKARRKQVIVVPDRVEVVAPSGESEESLHKFVESKRRWIYDRREEMQEILCGIAKLGPQRLVSGAKIPYRGRQTMLRVHTAEVENVRVEYRNGFIIDRSSRHSDAAVESALVSWLKDRARRDVAMFTRRHTLNVDPRHVRVRDLKHHWGSCSASGAIHLNWRLIFAPKPVLEYAVVHELCHLLHRNHSPEFWSAVRRMLPDYEQRKAWLDRNEHALERMTIGRTPRAINP